MTTTPRIRFAGPEDQSPRGPRTVRLGLVGVGTVGTGTLKVLHEHRREIERRLGCRLEVKVVCSRHIHRKDLSWLGRKVEKTRDWRRVVADPAVDIVIELTGDLRVAHAIAVSSLRHRKHLVTANKQLVAEYGRELVEKSEATGVSLGIEACVAGGTPILHAIREGLAGEHFAAVFGILNGTTNYILTEMERRGATFDQALAEAQQKGYAEPDPTFDVEGFDARYKIAILAMVCFGQAVEVESIPVEGITRIDQVDFAYAHRLERTIRLIAAARRRGNRGIEIQVRPVMIPRSSQLAGVLGTTNGIMLLGNKGGTTTLTGRGAGGEATGIAVVSDVVEIARAIVLSADGRRRAGRATPLGYAHWHTASVVSPQENTIATYLRLVVRDRPGILAKVCAILARHRINIDSVLQEPVTTKRHLPFVMTLEPTQEKRVVRAVKDIARQPFLVEPPLMLPFADLP